VAPLFVISAQDWQRKVALTRVWHGKAGVIRRFVLLEWPGWPIPMAIPDGNGKGNPLVWQGQEILGWE